jgi:hypothetical protein
MVKTFKAILKNNTLQWLDETPEINSEYPVNVYITLLEENIIGENRSNGQKMANALKKIALNDHIIIYQKKRRDCIVLNIKKRIWLILNIKNVIIKNAKNMHHLGF